MKKWIVRIVVGWISVGVLLVAAFFIYRSYYYRSYYKERAARVAEIEAFYPSEARVFLYSLESTPSTPRGDRKGEWAFHGYPIRGSVEITAWDEKAALILSLAKGVEKSYAIAACFDPHHGLRIVEGEREVDLVICFSCMQVRPYNFGDNRTFTTAGFPFAVYDAILQRHGLPIHERKKAAENGTTKGH